MSVFGSVFETSLRILILLDCTNRAMSLDEIQIRDFMARYAREYGKSDANLNGDNPFMYSELASSRNHLKVVLQELVLKGLIRPEATNSGIVYGISEKGHIEAEKLKTSYAVRYRETVTDSLSDGSVPSLPEPTSFEMTLLNAQIKRGDYSD